AWHVLSFPCLSVQDPAFGGSDVKAAFRTINIPCWIFFLRISDVGRRWGLDRFVVSMLIAGQAMQRFFFMAWFGHRALVASDPIALGILTDSNPIFRLLRLGFLFIRSFGAKLHPRVAIMRFLFNDLQGGRCGLGTK